MARPPKRLGLPPLILVAAVLGGCVHGENGGGTGREPAPDAKRSGGEARADSGRKGPAGAGEQRRRHRARAFVALEGEDRVAILDGPPWRLARTVAVPSRPHNVAADPAGRPSRSRARPRDGSRSSTLAAR